MMQTTAQTRRDSALSADGGIGPPGPEQGRLWGFIGDSPNLPVSKLHFESGHSVSAGILSPHLPTVRLWASYYL